MLSLVDDTVAGTKKKGEHLISLKIISGILNNSRVCLIFENVLLEGEK